jgi:protocatechuate 3,4-dioxygenase beta subunit
MRVSMLLVFLSIFIFFGTVSSRAWQQPGQGGRISGDVRDAATGQALKGARVILEGRSSANPQNAVTDDKGQFVFDHIQPGMYFIHAEQDGYITDRLPSGYAKPVPLSINVEASRDHPVSLGMVRTASIDGRVYDVNRQPVAKAEIQLLLPQYSGFGRRTLRTLTIVSPDNYPAVRTDDHGEYHFSGIPAGEYYIRAALGAQPASTTGVVVRANNAAPTYYPGVTTADDAVSIKVTGGVDLHAIDFTLTPVSPIKVSGRIMNPLIHTGRSTYDFYLVPRNAKLMEGMQPVPNHSNKEGEFELWGVRPGSYDLYVGFRMGAERPGNFKFYTGRTSLEVTDHDVTDLTVVIEAGVDIAGQIVLDQSARDTKPNIRNLYPLFFVLDGMPSILGPTAELARSSFVQEDGTFTIPNAARGRYYLTMVLAGAPTLYLASARLDTGDILGRPFEINAKTEGPLILEVSGSGGTVQGMVVDKNGAPVSGAQVMLVPPIDFRDDQTAYKGAMTNERGRFRIVGLRPGTYTAYSIPQRAEAGAWMNPEFITPYLSFGVQVDIPQGQAIERKLEVITLK